MAYRSKTISLSDAVELIAESLGKEAGQDQRKFWRVARYELIEALRDGAIEAEGEHITVLSNQLLRCVEIRKVSRVWWAEAVVEPPLHVDLWKSGCISVNWVGGGSLVIGPWISPPSTDHLIEGAISVRRIRLEEAALLPIWPINDPGAEPAARATRRRSAEDDRRDAIVKLLETGRIPGKDIPWGVFYKEVRKLAGKDESVRGSGDESIKANARRILQRSCD